VILAAPIAPAQSIDDDATMRGAPVASDTPDGFRFNA
jgi:hypothetical protein